MRQDTGYCCRSTMGTVVIGHWAYPLPFFLSNYSSSTISPSKEMAAGPVMRMWLSVAFHSMWRVPPSIWMLLWRLALPVMWAATAVAQAPVPQARVMPEPRSHTRIRSPPTPEGGEVKGLTNSMLQRWGKRGWCSNRGP